MTRSTTELQQRTVKVAGLCEGTRHMSSRLRYAERFAIALNMKPSTKQSREDRLAEALRANLRRRKAAPVKPDLGRANSQKPAD
jgi:hypothetical protein